MTLKEIAKLAGVSAATVSYVLNDSANISEKTRKKVLDIVEETGYTSNFLAKSLRENRTKLIGIVAEDVTFAHTSIIIDGITEFAEEKGYKTILSNLRFLSKIESRFESIKEYKSDISSAVNILLSMQVDGIIYIGMHDRNLKNIIGVQKKPLVYCHCFSDVKNNISVLYNNENAAYEATKVVIEKGHRKIGLITGMTNSYPAHKRLQGFQKALKEFNIKFDLDYVRNGYWNFEKGKEAALDLFSLKERPTAVFAMNDEMAMGVYEAAHEKAIRIPKDLSVIGFDNADFTTYIRPRLSTVSIPLKTMGNVSADKIIQMAEGKKIDYEKTSLECNLKIKDSILDIN